MSNKIQYQINMNVFSDQEQYQNCVNIKSLEKRQTQNRFFNHGFQHFSIRKSAICRVLLANCNRLSLKKSSMAISVAIFDASISLQDFPASLIEHVAKVALKIAVKLNENEADFLVEYFLQAPNQQDRVKEVQLEQLILKNLDYKVHFVTCFHFLEVLLRFDGVSMELPSNPVIDSFRVKKFSDLVYALNVIVSSEYQFNQFTSLSVAVATLMIARYFCKADELLPEVVETVTGLTRENLGPILELILDAVEGAVSHQD